MIQNNLRLEAEILETKLEAIRDIKRASLDLKISLAVLDENISNIPKILEKLSDLEDRLNKIESNTNFLSHIKITEKFQ